MKLQNNSAIISLCGFALGWGFSVNAANLPSDWPHTQEFAVAGARPVARHHRHVPGGRLPGLVAAGGQDHFDRRGAAGGAAKNPGGQAVRILVGFGGAQGRYR